ncbi:hypothetical protein CEP53_009168 [Fusarium sp. AF-6]|nr:hypothetical protein CEP53_009168 [Fusarium sp. AF-6]
MGDPLSVAGSAVGIISLGIQVCQGLVQYADAVRGQQRDVDDGMDEVRSLLAVFKSLEQTITRIKTDSPENAKSLLEYLRQAEAKLGSLEVVLKEVGILVDTSGSIKGKMEKTCRAAIYPMKKSKLDGARQNVQSILVILTTALQTVDLDLNVSHSDALKGLQSSTTSNASELKVAIEANSDQLGGLQVTSQQGFSDLNSNLVLGRAEIQDFSSRSTGQLESISVDVKEGLESIRLLTRMIRDAHIQVNAATENSRTIGSHNQNALVLAKLGPRVPPSSLKQACDLSATDADLIPRRLLDILEPDDECLIEVILTLYPALDCISPLLRSRIPSLDVSPMAYAILSRSMYDLEYQLKLAPTSVLERTYSYTTLQLASAWPQGFMRLMQTDARTLLHEPMRGGNLLAPRPTFGFDLYWHPSTLETLLDAGYTLFPDNKYITLQLLLNECTDATAQIMAKHLSQRLRQLSELAAKFGITSNDDSSIPDFVTAARWCLSLEELGEFIDPSIRVPMSDDMVTTIYHFWVMPLHFFPIFYAYGFIHVNACDHKGLPPLFVRFELFWNGEEEYFLSQRVPNDYPEVIHNLPWLRKHGLLSQKPHDPQGLGLNIDATGAHRVAAEIGSKFYLNLGDQKDVDHYLSLVTDLLRQFSGDSYRDLDKCACWCNSDGGGCSPIKLLYKSLAHPTQRYCGIWVFTRNEFQAASITRLLFDFDIFEVPTATPTAGVEQLRERDETTNAQPSTRALELVRLLTFEALEMTHTCCMLEELAKIDHDFRVILKCNPNTVSDIRQSEAEQRNAVQLDTLMKDFTNVMQQDYYAKSLLDFVFGYWKTRVEDLYAVREDEVQKMQQHVSNVRTDHYEDYSGLVEVGIREMQILRYLTKRRIQMKIRIMMSTKEGKIVIKARKRSQIVFDMALSSETSSRNILKCKAIWFNLSSTETQTA